MAGYDKAMNGLFYEPGPLGTRMGCFKHQSSRIAFFTDGILNSPAFEEPMEFDTFDDAKEYMQGNFSEIYKNLPLKNRNPYP